MIQSTALIFFGLISAALGQTSDCTLTPVANTAIELTTCQVLRRGGLNTGLRWELQQRVFRPAREGSGDAVMRVMVVTERGQPVAWTEPGDGSFERPEQLPWRGGLLLRFPVTGAGAASPTLDEVWSRRTSTGGWVSLDARSWREEAESRMRPGESLMPQFRLTLRPLSATGHIARASDPVCCPRGGGYTAWLEVGEDRLLLTGFTRR